eukprot:scaffold2603_cov100-Isochrysis_galbana.AAC.6
MAVTLAKNGAFPGLRVKGRRALGALKKKKSLVETRYTLTAARRDTLCHLPSGHSPSPIPFVPHPFSLFRPSLAEGWRPSCVHYNSLGKSIESLGFSVVLNPMSASLTASL